MLEDNPPDAPDALFDNYLEALFTTSPELQAADARYHASLRAQEDLVRTKADAALNFIVDHSNLEYAFNANAGYEGLNVQSQEVRTRIAPTGGPPNPNTGPALDDVFSLVAEGAEIVGMTVAKDELTSFLRLIPNPGGRKYA